MRDWRRRFACVFKVYLGRERLLLVVNQERGDKGETRGWPRDEEQRSLFV